MGLEAQIPTLRIEIGKTWLWQHDIASLAAGSTVELDARTGGGMDVYLNSRLIARGEPVVVNGRLGVRVLEVIDPVA